MVFWLTTVGNFPNFVALAWPIPTLSQMYSSHTHLSLVPPLILAHIPAQSHSSRRTYIPIPTAGDQGDRRHGSTAGQDDEDATRQARFAAQMMEVRSSGARDGVTVMFLICTALPSLQTPVMVAY